jgi:transposase
MMPLLPEGRVFIADRAYGSRWMRQTLHERGFEACIPSQRRRQQFPYDRAVYRQRHRIENMFARLKDWRRIHTRYDRCADIFLAAITLAAIVLFWINES